MRRLWRRQFWRCRGVRAVGGFVAVSVCLAAATLAAGDVARVVDANQVEPALGASAPWRRLGDSEFRLAWGDTDSRPFRFSADGKLIAAANGRDVRIWRYPSGKLLHDLSAAIDTECIAFSADGKQLLALEQRQLEIRRFDVTSGKQIDKTKLKDFVNEGLAPQFFFSDDGNWLVATAEHAAAWDSATGERRLWAPMERTSANAAQGVLLLWGYKFVDRYDLATGKQLSSVRRDGVADVVISNATGTVMSGYSDVDRAIVFYDPAKNQAIGGKIPFEAAQEWGWSDAMISADGSRFVTWRKRGPTYFEREVVVYDVATGKLVNSFPALDSYLIAEPIISPDGKYVLLAEGRVVFTPIEVATGKPVTPLVGPSMDIEALSFTPDGNTLIVGSRDKCQAWDVASATPGMVFDDEYTARNFAAVDVERVLMYGSGNEVARLLEIKTGEVVKRYVEIGQARLDDLQLSEDRREFTFLGGDRLQQRVSRWGVESGRLVAEELAVKERRNSMTIDQNYFLRLICGGRYLTRLDRVRRPSRRPSGAIDWWRTDLVLDDWVEQKEKHRFEVPAQSRRAIDGTPDRKVLAMAVADDWTNQHLVRRLAYLMVWDLARSAPRFRVVRDQKTVYTPFSLVKISADGRLFATASERDKIEVWDGMTGELLQRFDGGSVVAALEFSDDGGRLASGQRDGRVLVWDTRAAATWVKR